jgi:glyoxylase-like metal-dependent hydrolase (beta-lactamase superfamily II)
MISRIRIGSLLLLLNAGVFLFSQTLQKGPYTLHEISANVYRIEDANEKNPPGMVTGDDGQVISMNNCSDMYLVVGEEKGLLIDLSNQVKWDTTAIESLRSLVYEHVGTTELHITVTHKHGDHLGMLPAFSGDPRARFWVPGNEFSAADLFPDERTEYFKENSSLDLGGGFVVNTLEVPGHTPHSTIFFLEGSNLGFTGDAIGSGSGVWLFNEESFYTYIRSIDSLISYVEDLANHVDKEKLRIFGGHFWQGREPGGLSARYIYDMRTLIGEMKKGTAATEEMSSFISFLDTNFTYGTATITWNREAASRFAGSAPGE